MGKYSLLYFSRVFICFQILLFSLQIYVHDYHINLKVITQNTVRCCRGDHMEIGSRSLDSSTFSVAG